MTQENTNITDEEILNPFVIDLLKKEEKQKLHCLSENRKYIKIKDKNNYPRITKGDIIELDTSIKDYQGDGWYLINNEIFRVESTPQPAHRYFAIFQFSGKLFEIEWEGFSAQGRLVSITRECE